MPASPRRVQHWEGADGEPSAERAPADRRLRWAVVPQVSHGFGADQREDDVVVLLTLEPVHRRHLHQKKKMSKQYYYIKRTLVARLLSKHLYTRITALHVGLEG